MALQAQNDFGPLGLETWKTILNIHSLTRKNQIIGIFNSGIEKLKISSEEIPSLEKINLNLKELTGFQGVFVNGLEDGRSFYKMLSERKFPVGNFIRGVGDLNYTPEPDIIHDLYGHLPFFVYKRYSDFCQAFGAAACRFSNNKDSFEQFERFFWFTVEFGLVKTSKGIRIFGAGIASSLGECEYALSDQPEVVPFDIDVIRKQDFRIDEMQSKLFLMESVEQLYESLPELCLRLENE